MVKHKLRLFITGQSAISLKAKDNLYSFCESYLKDSYELKVIDVLKEPESAENEKILATPTVIKDQPTPSLRVIGDMTAYDKISQGLNIQTI